MRRPVQLVLGPIRRIGKYVRGQSVVRAKRNAYSLNDARAYWRYPPSKAHGKRDTAEYAQESDEFIKNLIEREIELRDARQDTRLFKDKVAEWVKRKNSSSMLDFGCGLGEDGLYFAKALGLAVTFADIVPPNVALVSRYANIWNVPTRAVLVDDPKTFDFGHKFDLIFSNGVLHHSPEAPAIVANLKRFLQRGGLFIVMLYTRAHYEQVGALTGADYINKSESSPPVPVNNPWTEYYDTAKARELFKGCTLLDQWTTYREMFGWYCFALDANSSAT